MAVAPHRMLLLYSCGAQAHLVARRSHRVCKQCNWGKTHYAHFGSGKRYHVGSFAPSRMGRWRWCRLIERRRGSGARGMNKEAFYGGERGGQGVGKLAG